MVQRTNGLSNNNNKMPKIGSAGNENGKNVTEPPSADVMGFHCAYKIPIQLERLLFKAKLIRINYKT